MGTAAKSAVVISRDTGEIIYEQNCHERLPMASTTKIMTALLLCELGDLDRKIVTTKEMVTVEGSSMGLLEGDTVSLRDLLYGMLLASGNDAANTVAIVIGGSIPKFVKLMNERARKIGLKNTNFVTPSGLDDEEHYTTAFELALIAREALKNEEFAKAAATKSVVLSYGNPPYRRTLTNHNRLLKSYDDVIGVKTGFTKKSGRCLVSAAECDGKSVIAVTLNDGNDWQDHRTLLDYGLENIKNSEVYVENQNLTILVVGGQKRSIDISIPKSNFNVVDSTKISYVINIPDFIYAPVSRGDAIGNIIYYCDGEIIASEVITSGIDVSVKESNTIIKIFKNILSNI